MTLIPQPDADPVTRVRPPLPETLRLRAENRSLREQLAALETRLGALQQANEGLYAAEYDRTGGPALDPGKPFGEMPPGRPTRPFVSVWRPGGTQ